MFGLLREENRFGPVSQGRIGRGRQHPGEIALYASRARSDFKRPAILGNCFPRMAFAQECVAEISMGLGVTRVDLQSLFELSNRFIGSPGREQNAAESKMSPLCC